MNISKRNTALDITRIVAFFSVLAIHFWLYTGYYSKPMIGSEMLVFTTVRTAFSYCVPLFILLSGYLLNEKKLSAKYYLGITKTLGIFILASICCILFKSAVHQKPVTFLDILFGILDYRGADYAWYVEMYVGLFLLIPFINLMYHGLNGKKQKKILIWTLIGLTALPTALNIFNFTEPGWFQTPIISDHYQPLVVDWWIDIYPLTYYMIGAYLKEYPIQMKKRYNLFLLAIAMIVFGLFNFYRDQGGTFSWSSYTDWYGIEALVLSFLVFLFFSQRNTEKCPLFLKKMLAHVSDLCLGAYLMSYLSDCMIYPYLWKIAPDLTDKFSYFVPVILLGGIISLLMSQCINWIYKLLEWFIKLILKIFRKPIKQEDSITTA